MAFGTLQRKSPTPPMGEINMTPLIDVMLVLLVIVMLTAPLLVGAIKIDLPRQGGVAMAAQPAHVDVVLDAAGRAFVQNLPEDDASLSRLLARAAASDKHAELRLSADVRVPHGRVVEVMALAHRNGLTRVAFVTRAGEAPPRP
ncbi:MAG: biopolymer transporter ExbD [Rhodoferax sp.]|nr:MAG: biopolymer transporter ExbD [Rhodoferax sp.]